jgi:UDP-N-acetylglucosamine 2-epimerase (non-hydrolysing)
MGKPRLAIVLGIRPDVIRASLVLKALRAHPDVEIKFIWSGQHYSDNLKDVFFRELAVAPPEIELNATGSTDAELVASIISNLFPVLEAMQPAAVVFLGDTNTVMGCLAAAQCNLPIVHIEGCMRSYDWRMPEEKYRTTIDHLSDVIYAYFEEYKRQGVAEGLNPANIVVVQNLIVDVLQQYYFDRRSKYDAMASDAFFRERGIERSQYYLMTCHRRENVYEAANLRNVLALVASAKRKTYFPASYRTQRQFVAYDLKLPSNAIMVDPVGYDEMLTLMANARGVLTDSGTLVEEAAILQVPSVQMRRSTERPQVYDCGASIKFDPSAPDRYLVDGVLQKLESLYGKTWNHGLGDGHASQRIVDDLVSRAHTLDGFRNHQPKRYHLDVRRAYRDDELPIPRT